MRVLDLESVTQEFILHIRQKKNCNVEVTGLEFVSQMHVKNEITHYLLNEIMLLQFKNMFSSPFGN